MNFNTFVRQGRHLFTRIADPPWIFASPLSQWQFLFNQLTVNVWFPLSGAARGQDAVEWVTSVPELCGLATQKKGSRSTPGMSSTIRSITSSPSCLRSVLAKGHPTSFSPSSGSSEPATYFSGRLTHWHQVHSITLTTVGKKSTFKRVERTFRCLFGLKVSELQDPLFIFKVYLAWSAQMRSTMLSRAQQHRAPFRGTSSDTKALKTYTLFL